MAAHCRGAGQALRPHAKSHKSPDIAQAQIAAGAAGQCCATLREAEVLTEAGISGILVTSPPTGAAKVARLMALHRKAPDIAAPADATAAAGAATPLRPTDDPATNYVQRRAATPSHAPSQDPEPKAGPIPGP